MRWPAVQFLKPVRDYVDTLVHPSVQGDALTTARHRAFIGPRLIGSSAALAAFPVYLAMRGVPSALEIVVFAWLIAPICTAYFLSRTGRYESAHVLSSLALTGLVTIVAAKTGGITSFAAIWLVIVPLEAALSASRRVVATASTLALCAAGLLMFSSAYHLLPVPATPEQGHGALAALGIISAALYATGLALGAESLARMSFWLLYAEEDRYRLLARNMTDVITRHGRNGAVVFASPAAEPLFGAPVAELLGHGLFERVHVADRPAYLTTLSDARDEARSVEFRVRRDRGGNDASDASRFIWIEMRCRPLDRALGEIAQPHGREVVAVMREVSDRKAQEQALEDARSEAEQANVAKSRFLATMSHELRTPLNAIIGFSEMLVNETQMRLDGNRRREYAALINDSGNHLLSVVNGILDMTKLDTGDFEIRPEPFRLAAVVGGCCDLLALKAGEAGIELVADVPADLPEIVADKRAVKQILINLISNAIKFTDRGGRVSTSAVVEGAILALTVEDNGIGIGEEDLPRIGKPFFQARGSYDRRHDGTGLGLSIVKGLATLHGGDVVIRSRVGVGTRITVRMPVDCEAARPQGAPKAIKLAPRAGAESGLAPREPTKVVKKSA
ncbi:MAG TPA: PAS domain-containing sensor histidine kinase [Xanthobacteraceae bacterium]